MLIFRRLLSSAKGNNQIDAYLNKLKQNKNLIDNENLIYDQGRKYLARMMGEDEQSFTDEKLAEAIQYLFPSMLYNKNARPQFKRPVDVYPKQTILDIDLNGRPKNSLFYTGKPNFFTLCYDAIQLLEFDKDDSEEVKKEDQLKNINWISKETLESSVNEKITDPQYEDFVKILNRLADKSSNKKVFDFISKYRMKKIQDTNDTTKKVKVVSSNKDNSVVESFGQKKNAFAEAILKFPGSGKITVDGKSLLFAFPEISDREQIVFPLNLANLCGKVDVEAKVFGPYGNSSKANSLRLAIARGLSTMFPEKNNQLYLAGLLTEDQKSKERSKPGRRGPRRPPIWKAR